MKCPKCGYTSFESYDSCRKCSADLVEFKQSHGLTPVIIPPSLRSEMAGGLGLSQTEGDNTADTAGDMFTFDLPTTQQPASPASAAASSPFSFDDPPAAPSPFSFDTPSSSAPQDPFAALLSSPPEPQKPAAAAQQPATQGFEMNSFSWDDTPTPGQPGEVTPASAPKTEDDDFNSLFGDLDGSEKK